MSAPAVPVADFPRPLAAAEALSVLDLANGVMKALASLKLTVALFVAGIFIVYVGTVAQQQADIWQVVHDYFHAWVMWVDVNLLFPKVFFSMVPEIRIPAPEFLTKATGGFITNLHTFPAPGGFTLGLLMAINLLAAHGWRFTMQAKGLRLALGLVVSVIGLGVGVLIIWAGHNAEGFQAKPPFSWGAFWIAFLAASTLLWLAAFAGYVVLIAQAFIKRRQEGGLPLVEFALVRMLGVPLLGAGSLVAWGIMAAGRPDDEALRIVWQLVEGGLAGLVLLVGCILIFKKRGGMVLLHLGVGLLMFNELWVAMKNREQQVFIPEGRTVNYLRDVRTVELALVDRSGQKEDEHVVVPRSLLEANFRANQKRQKAGEALEFINDPQLPAKVAVLEYFKNADVQRLRPSEKGVATTGNKETLGEKLVTLPVAKGTDTGGEVDLAGAYVRFADRQSGADLGTLLLSQLVDMRLLPDAFGEPLKIGAKTYDVFLRFKREYKPFTLHLVDVRKDDYVASEKVKNYSSDVRIEDPEAGVHQTVHIKMNDPLRYRGETYYQSNYGRLPSGLETTTLQVVRNRGWMIPYIACMVVVIGLIAHFLITVTRFVNRRVAEEQAAGDVIVAQLSGSALDSPRSKRKAARRATGGGIDWSLIGLPLLAAGVFAAWIGAYARPPRANPDGMNLVAFGQLPVAQEGRIKPLDTFARNSLRALSLRETAKADSGRKLSAVEWLLEVVTGSELSQKLKVIRIDNLDVLKVFDLQRREGFLYSVEEIRPHTDEFLAQLAAMTKSEQDGKTTKDERTVVQRKLIELHERLQLYITLTEAFSIPPLPSPEQLKDEDFAREFAMRLARYLDRTEVELKNLKAPQPIPVAITADQQPKEAWQFYPVAWRPDRRLGGGPMVAAFEEMKAAYADDNPRAFNDALARYESMLRRESPPLYSPTKVSQEAYFNYVAPFYVGIPLYVLAFLVAVFAWLMRYRPLNWTAFTLVLLTFLFHTVALGSRLYISGRPPVTNLYSSAIFIGWAAVLFGLAIEAIFRLGLGNIVASAAGFATLLIAHFYFSGGDTITVLEAVLDTQFWLATHVVCVTFGYTATYVAGLFAVLYVLCGLFTPLLNQSMRKDLGRMIYGVTCFAILFSFFGTVLGGLWADDSWGRFWGWDPKENGALIIVLWNALILHARWDKLVGDRGLAVLALGGNIVTSWSWFGVNQLGIGLHSYGFTDVLVVFLQRLVVVHLVLILLGCLPTSWWWSYRAEEQQGVGLKPAT